MRYNYTPMLLLFIAFTLSPRTVMATLVPALDVPRLTDEASLVVVGEVTSLSEEERGNFQIREHVIAARRMTAFFRVDRVLKGKAHAELSFSFFIPDQFVGFASLVAGQYGVFFFRSTPEGVVLASPYYPFVVAARRAYRSGLYARRSDLPDPT